jgi:hypothetical protein
MHSDSQVISGVTMYKQLHLEGNSFYISVALLTGADHDFILHLTCMPVYDDQMSLHSSLILFILPSV